MKETLCLPVITSLVYCIDKELYKAIDYLREQVRVLVEHQESQGNRIRLTNRTIRSTWHEFIKSH